MRHLFGIIICIICLVLSGCQNADKLALIELTPANIIMHINDTQNFNAIGRNSKGEEVPIEPEWILNEEIGTLSSTTGTSITFTATTKGSSFLKVVADGISENAFISVTELILTRLQITPEQLHLGLNQTYQFELTGEDQFGHPMAVTTPDYELTNNIGTFDPKTLTFTATTAGTTTLTLNIGDASASSEITIENPIQIPDSALEIIVREKLNLPSGPLFPYQLATITHLDAKNQMINNLEGLQYCTTLERLDLTQNQITDLSPLSGLTQLYALFLNDNTIENLTPIRQLFNLKTLTVANNPISDPEDLNSLLKLEVLDLTKINLKHIEMLSRMENMKALYLSYNPELTDITAVENMTLLEILHLSGTLVSDLTPLTNKQHLKELYARGTSIGSSVNQLAPLIGCIALEYLSAHASGISDITPLAELTTLRILNLARNSITDISPLQELGNLEELSISENQITNITPLIDNTGVNEGDIVHVENNQLNLEDNSNDRLQIATLEKRGVIIYYLPTLTEEIEDFTPSATTSNLKHFYSKSRK